MTADLLISAIGGAIAGIVTAYVALRMLPSNIRVAKSEEHKNTGDALKQAIDTLMDSLAITDRLQERVNKQEGEIDALKSGREKRTEEIEELKTQIELLERQYAREITALKNQYVSEIAALKHGWRDWYSRFKVWISEKELTGYPEPPAYLLDTGEHKTVDK